MNFSKTKNKLTQLIGLILIGLVLTKCKNGDKEVTTNFDISNEIKNDDRYIGIVKTDTVLAYIESLEIDSLLFTYNNSKLKVTTNRKNKDIFYVKILGQPLSENNNSLKQLVTNSKFSKNWKSIDNKTEFGFESDIFVRDNISYTYIPYEILITLNKQREIKNK